MRSDTRTGPERIHGARNAHEFRSWIAGAFILNEPVVRSMVRRPAGVPSLGFAIGTLRILAVWVHPTKSLEDLAAVQELPPALRQRAESFSDQLGIETIALYQWDHPTADAIPVGDQSGGLLVVTTGLIDRLDEDALDAALAHELAHVRLGHATQFGIAVAALLILVAVVRTKSWLGAILGVVLGALGILALTRQYEREADHAAIAHLDDPETLARALLMIRTGDQEIDPREYVATTRGPIANLVSIYPPVAERLAYILEPPELEY